LSIEAGRRHARQLVPVMLANEAHLDEQHSNKKSGSFESDILNVILATTVLWTEQARQGARKPAFQHVT
jgi:hypothetical protein